MPFIVIPTLILLCELLDNIELLKMNRYIIGSFLILISAVFGFLSPSNRSIDCLITLIVPLSLFYFMFFEGFLSKSDLETRFHLSRAFDVAFQPMTLLMYVALAIITFVASLKFLRNNKIRTVN